ncbi:hypothetical protein N7533_008485 [Penicillium manginii]|uniref:uncharacterized protein n=1 Tax=Penicillium manginii TaxID=203109 RepID=UPI002548C6B5|nr:uncharacterized protein N7533_008485 [Penicillium manginii]KAJ5743615.1 hypothetical protein N7533_008485 [Penicillium manginii]
MSNRNPKDSMKSTWRTDKSQWGIPHKILNHANVFHSDLTRPIPIHAKTDKLPHLPDWQSHRWILLHASIPLALHQIWLHFTSTPFHPIIAFIFYYQASRFFAFRQLRSMRELGHQYGYLDGDKHDRDGVPDVGVGKTLLSVFLAGFVRPVLTTWLTYTTTEEPLYSLLQHPTRVFFEIALYSIAVDFWFYIYHRLMHDVSPLWKYHRTHHLTKHPNPLLTIYADSVQEFFDIAGIPLLAWGTMKLGGFPMGFYEWHVCQLYVLFAEVAGHSGLRIHATVPNPLAEVMRWFGMDLVIEDHDLHHRNGWRRSMNYGKQTRIWDRVFGTCGERIESLEGNVDYGKKVTMPIF